MGFRKAIESIGQVCKEGVLILVETTVPPGTCQKVVYPILANLINNPIAMKTASENAKSLAETDFSRDKHFQRL